jgi:hypothetical protein
MMRFEFRRFSIALAITMAAAFVLAAPSGAVAQAAEKITGKMTGKS